MTQTNPLQWFIDRIGKTIYRDKVFATEPKVVSITIVNKQHACDIYDNQSYIITYRDNP